MFTFKNKLDQEIFPIGLQAHNSSTDTRLIQKTIKAIQAVNGNCMEAPVYWYLLEPERDQYDTAHVKNLIDEARAAGLYLILLWFGTSKNGHPNYVPEYIKRNPATFLMAKECNRAPLEALSVHCMNTLERDKAAFCRLMTFLKEYDGAERTVIAVQVENEMGYGGTDRDYSEAAEADYVKEVPQELSDIVIENTQAESLSEASAAQSPWKRKFGRYAQEAFSAWYTARYINTIARAGKEIYPLSMSVNLMVGENSYEEAGLCYNAGAPVSRMLDLWKAAAPDIDVIGPDIYNEERRTYEKICRNYSRKDNPLYIPESPIRGEANAMNLILAAGQYGAAGLFCFGAESMLEADETIRPESYDIALSMRTVAAMAPLLMKYRGSDRIWAIAEDEFEKYRYLQNDQYHIIAKFTKYLTMYYGYSLSVDKMRQAGQNPEEIRGRAILVQTGENEFYLGGAGVALDFVKIPDAADERSYSHMNARSFSQLNFLSVEEGHFEDDNWVCDFRRNGDESNFSQYVLAGEVIRIRLNPKTLE